MKELPPTPMPPGKSFPDGIPHPWLPPPGSPNEGKNWGWARQLLTCLPFFFLLFSSWSRRSNLFKNLAPLCARGSSHFLLKEDAMKTPLWKPSEQKIKNANITRFIEYVNKKQGKKFRGYFDLYQWSIDQIPDFWARMWEFCGYQGLPGI